jgi:WD40 repeat protein
MRGEQPEDGPYIGPRPFDSADQKRFFGRSAEVRKLVSLMVAHRVVLLYSASGAGKTSLLNAGLVPLLRQDAGFDVLPIVGVRGLADPEASANPYLANAIASLVGDARDPASADDFTEPRSSAGKPSGLSAKTGEVQNGMTLLAALAARPRSRDADGFAAPTALIFDQFEDLFSLYPERWDARRHVFAEIGAAIEQDDLLRVVIALREEFIAQLDPYASLLPGSLRTRFRLERLGPNAALAAITGPLAREKRRFAPGTAERLVDGLQRVRFHAGRGESMEIPGEFVEPVQLQVVCRSLWSNLAPDVVEITDDHVAAFGNIADVLARYYGDAVAVAAAKGAIAEEVLRDRLEESFITSIGTRGTVVSGATETARIPNDAIDELERRHLLRAEWRAGARWFELTHDSLITPINASNAIVRERAQRRRERRLKALLAATLAVTLALAAAGVWLVRRDTTPPLSPIGVLNASGPMSGLELKRTFTATAPLLSATFAANGRAIVAAGSDGRIRVWDVNAHESARTLDYGDVGLFSIDVSRDGRYIVASGTLGPRRWAIGRLGVVPPSQTRIRRELLLPSGSLDPRLVGTGLLDPTGNELAVVSRGNAALFGILGGRVSANAISDHLFGTPVLRLAWNPKQPLIAAVAVDGSVRIARSGPSGVGLAPVVPASAGPASSGAAASYPAALRSERTLHADGEIVSAGFSPDGRMLVTASTDGKLRLWRTRDGRLLGAFGGGSVPLVDAAFSPNGRAVVSAAKNGRAEVWSLGGTRLAEIRASHGALVGAGFAAGGRLLITAGADGVTRLWATTTPVRPFPSNAYVAEGYYARPFPNLRTGAMSKDGRRYAASATVTVASGTSLRGPEAGVLIAPDLTRASRTDVVRLRTATGRLWVFSGVYPRQDLKPGTRIAAGAAVADARGDGANPAVVRIELWQRASGGHRFANLWNPVLFLNIDDAARGRAPYPGDDAPREAIARWMGGVANATGLPPELPVMAALVETGLRNVADGDSDSAGYFLMRRTIWDEGPYRGFQQKPELQLKWFIDYALAVKRERLAQGERGFLHDSSQWGDWAADVERPAEQYRGRYQQRLEEARQLLGLTPVS